MSKIEEIDQKRMAVQTSVTFDAILRLVISEAKEAMKNWPAFNSAHEGWAVLEEECDELKAHVHTNQKRRDLIEMKKEAIQVAAMAIRFAYDVCDEKNGRK